MVRADRDGVVPGFCRGGHRALNLTVRPGQPRRQPRHRNDAAVFVDFNRDPECGDLFAPLVGPVVRHGDPRLSPAHGISEGRGHRRVYAVIRLDRHRVISALIRGNQGQIRHRRATYLAVRKGQTGREPRHGHCHIVAVGIAHRNGKGSDRPVLNANPGSTAAITGGEFDCPAAVPTKQKAPNRQAPLWRRPRKSIP